MASYQRPSREIEQTLKELRQLKKDTKHLGTPDFASEWMDRSMERIEVDLAEEAKAAKLLESKFYAKLAVNGDPVDKHAISAKFFGKLLIYVQDFVNALAAAEVRPPRTKLIERNRLKLADVGAGSFEARFILDDESVENKDELPLFDVVPIHIAMELLNRFLDGNTDIEENAENLLNRSVRTNYQRIISLLGEQGATVTLRTRDYPYGVTLTAQQARDRAQWIELMHSQESERHIAGDLVMGNLLSGRFEIALDNGERIHGRSVDHAAKQLKGIPLGSAVEATLAMNVITHEEFAFQPKVVYMLKDIRAVQTLFDSADTNSSPKSVGEGR